MPERTANAENTREALIRAALRLFGAKGFEGTSTREIAAAAGANIASIAYHFGGKEGLLIACAEYITGRMGTVAEQAIGGVPTVLVSVSPEEARARLTRGIEGIVRFILGLPEAADIVQFVLRQLGNPSPALDHIYRQMFEPVHIRLCQLWAAATGEPAESEAVKIAVFTLVGQLIYFRVAQPVVSRRMGWDGIGPEQSQAIARAVVANLHAILDSKGRNAE